VAEIVLSVRRPEVQFVRAEIQKKTGLVYCLDGLPKTGKTRFALTMPGPIVIHDFNAGLDGVIDPFIEAGKEIYPFTYEIPLSRDLSKDFATNLMESSKKSWETFAENFLASLKHGNSIVIDLGSEAWELVRLARFGKLDKVMAIQYGAVNVEFRQLTQRALRSGKNVAFLHKLKPEYKNDQKTGELERQGFGDIGFDVEATLRSGRDPKIKTVDQFSVTIEENRKNFKANGLALTGEKATFQNIAMAIYPDSKVEDWQ